ncbi:MAG: hypothetical protein AAFN92_14295 [Bacteroidota bacterium]
MSFRIDYSRLFTCRFEHAYYLDRGAATRFHALDPVADAATIADILFDYDLRTLLTIRPLPETLAVLAGHRTKMVADRQGFYLGISVRPAPAGGFVPVIAPGPDTVWRFALEPTRPAEWATVTEQPLRANLPAIYYFTNNRPDWAANTVPGNLVAPALPRQRRAYTAGEFVADGGGQRFRAQRSVADPAILLTDAGHWTPETDAYESITENDRVLLPTRFNYRVTPESGETPTSLDVTLNEVGGGVAVPTVTYPLSVGQETVRLNFTAVADGKWYDLVVTSNTNYATSHRIFLDDTAYDPTRWGVVAIGAIPADPTLRLFEADGRLRQDGGGEPDPADFLLRIPNRQSLWRYVPHPTQSLAAAPGFALDGANRLVATELRPLTRFGSPPTIPGGNGPVQLPLARTRALRPEKDGALYSEVHLGILDL